MKLQELKRKVPFQVSLHNWGRLTAAWSGFSQSLSSLSEETSVNHVNILVTNNN